VAYQRPVGKGSATTILFCRKYKHVPMAITGSQPPSCPQPTCVILGANEGHRLRRTGIRTQPGRRDYELELGIGSEQEMHRRRSIRISEPIASGGILPAQRLSASDITSRTETAISLSAPRSDRPLDAQCDARAPGDGSVPAGHEGCVERVRPPILWSGRWRCR